MQDQLPVPVVNVDATAYWQGPRDGKLLLQRCLDCRAPCFYPRALVHNEGGSLVALPRCCWAASRDSAAAS